MELQALPETVAGLPNLCGAWDQVKEVTRHRKPVFLPETNLRMDRLQAAFAITLHMQQPLIPATGRSITNSELMSNLDHRMRNQGVGDNHNATVFADCYGRMGDIIPELVKQGKNPRVMLDYSGELPYGLRKMGRGDVLERLRPISKWEPGAAEKALADLRKQNPHFSMEGGSCTNNISWVQGYENVLTPMNQLSAQFHQTLDHKKVDPSSQEYRNALFHLLVSETSCFRYWGQGVWTD